MSWPYHFIDVSDDQKHERRVLLDRYGICAQLSVLVPILGFQLYRLAIWVSSARSRAKTAYSEVPGSPMLKYRRPSTSRTLGRKWRSASWYLSDEFVPSWGRRGRLIGAGIWTAWLLFLCVHKTGDDYMHITKRFGEVAASQFPFHYMLSMKSFASPVAFLLHSSHEDLMPYHQISGRIIWVLLVQHGSWYLNSFIQRGILLQILTSNRAVILGMIAITFMNIIASSSLAIVRKWNYRAFFLVHVVLGISLPILLFFHASHMRIYMVEALAIFIIDVIARKLNTITGFATITKVPNTKLLKINLLLPESKLARFQAAAGQHVYLNIPHESTPPRTSNPSIHDLLYNPFTVAEVSDSSITLVVRSLKGPTSKALDMLSTSSKSRPPINIEGPYGASKKFPNLANYDRILLVGGGVGATFVLPIYRDVRDQLETEGKSPENVHLVWSMRSRYEAAWLSANTDDSLEKHANVQLYYTRTALDDHRDEIAPEDGSIELFDNMSLVQGNTEMPSGRHERPDLGKIVDDVFRLGFEETVAILVCGPTKLASDLRKHVGAWVGQGREVFWHDESFGL
ncbi:ferric reductase-like protein like transmembrane component [Calycina marina]|uniref:Ferric reductase-like protein like transmembrane component n=1 Tax=Calycina marina TaxID=1763456 RepID=A0A9P7Z8E0_9HELO|nr:ferric reductase-like protein like transmembrane component [Calycina marina]